MIKDTIFKLARGVGYCVIYIMCIPLALLSMIVTIIAGICIGPLMVMALWRR